MAIAFDLTPAQRLAVTWPGFKSICTCGHTGDGAGSQHSHEVNEGDGHGACKICGDACKQFSWRRWTVAFGNALHKVIHTRREAVSRGN